MCYTKVLYKIDLLYKTVIQNSYTKLIYKTYTKKCYIKLKCIENFYTKLLYKTDT